MPPALLSFKFMASFSLIVVTYMCTYIPKRTKGTGVILIDCPLFKTETKQQLMKQQGLLQPIKSVLSREDVLTTTDYK